MGGASSDQASHAKVDSKWQQRRISRVNIPEFFRDCRQIFDPPLIVPAEKHELMGAFSRGIVFCQDFEPPSGVGTICVVVASLKECCCVSLTTALYRLHAIDANKEKW